MMSLHNNKSKFLSLILRHDPAKIGVVLDQNGWADVEELCKKMPITLDILKEIVHTDSKGRYSFSNDGKMIRANQGHSIDVDVGLVEKRPPDVLYHGTAERFVSSICASGLNPMSRQYVHLSDNYETALEAGKRHGNPCVLCVDAARAFEDSQKFYLSENKVWLTKTLGPKYIARTYSNLIEAHNRIGYINWLNERLIKNHDLLMQSKFDLERKVEKLIIKLESSGNKEALDIISELGIDEIISYEE